MCGDCDVYVVLRKAEVARRLRDTIAGNNLKTWKFVHRIVSIWQLGICDLLLVLL